jgi:hypothetical protein
VTLNVRAVFGKARSVVGIDISDVAIARAKSLNLPNARFESGYFLQASFEGYDVITALECVHYLSFEEQGVFLEKSYQGTPRQNTSAFGSNRRLQKTLQS